MEAPKVAKGSTAAGKEVAAEVTEVAAAMEAAMGAAAMAVVRAGLREWAAAIRRQSRARLRTPHPHPRRARRWFPRLPRLSPSPVPTFVGRKSESERAKASSVCAGTSAWSYLTTPTPDRLRLRLRIHPGLRAPATTSFRSSRGTGRVGVDTYLSRCRRGRAGRVLRVGVSVCDRGLMKRGVSRAPPG